MMAIITVGPSLLMYLSGFQMGLLQTAMKPRRLGGRPSSGSLFTYFSFSRIVFIIILTVARGMITCGGRGPCLTL
jgi:hypothetical protein